jgi:DNA-binding Xre family transcriptional regulator
MPSSTMSEFGNMIKAFAPPKASVREIATRVDIDPTNLSRILTAPEGRSVQSETLSRICLGLTPSRVKQAELNAAYLRDLRIPSLRNLIEIQVAKEDKKPRKDFDPQNPAHVLATIVERLDAASVRALCQIAENLDNRPLRRAILSLGEVAAAGK